ncbi:MAG: LysR family transcriptional regulator [Alphaproteobacteria bacterium]
MNTRFLETFLWLARLKSFRATADRLHTTQPGISQRIAALERDLGVRLFVRDRHRVELTPEGREALRHAETIVAAAAALRERLADPATYQGTFRLGAIDSVIQTFLPALLDRVRRAAPRVTVEVIADTTLHLTRALEAGDVALAFVIEPPGGRQFEAVPLCRFAMAWVASPRLADPGRRYSVDALGRLPIITFPPNTPPYRLIESYFDDRSLLGVQSNSSNSLATMIRLAIDGLGIAAVPPAAIRHELDERLLLSLATEKPLPATDVLAVYPAAMPSAMVDLVMTHAHEAADGFARQLPHGMMECPVDNRSRSLPTLSDNGNLSRA